MKEKWSRLPKKDRWITLLVVLLSMAVIVLASLQILGIWEKAITVFEPLTGVILLLQALLHWKKNRKVAIFSLCAAGFVLAVAFAILIPPLLA